VSFAERKFNVKLIGLGLPLHTVCDIVKCAEQIFAGLARFEVFDLNSKLELKGFSKLRLLPYRFNKLMAKLTYWYAKNFGFAVSPDSFLALASLVADITGFDCAVIVAPIKSYQAFLGEIFGASDYTGIRFPRAAFVPLLSLFEKCPSYEVFINRASKLIAHEVAHVLGLKDCFSPLCVMMGRGGLEVLDHIPPSFCASCFFKLLSKASKTSQLTRMKRCV